MSTGIDANGRSFRWKSGKNQDCHHAVVGVPHDDNTGYIWNNAGAADPATTPKGIPLEQAWEALDYIRPDSQDKSVPILPASTAADYIADAVSQILPETDLASGLVLTIPNLLSEDGQFQLLEAFKQRRFYNLRLLWRPVALALAWAGENGVKALPTAIKDKSLWVYDFESVNLEVTVIKWRRIENRGDIFVCPVRGYPSERHWREDFRSHTAARDLAASVVGQASADSLVLGMYASAFQQNIETGKSDEAVLYQDGGDPRRWKRLQQMPTTDCLNLQKWAKEINDEAKANPDDMFIVHGWPTRSMRFSSPNVVVMDADAIITGATIFSKRLANEQPTYFDTLPEYRIWAEYKTDNNGKEFDWFTVVKEGTVEADHEWVASRDSDSGVIKLLSNFSIAQHKNELRLFVQNKTRYDDEVNKSELARKLIQPLTATTREPIGVSIEVKAKPASGHAIATLTVKHDQNKAILPDGRPAEFSWKAAEKDKEPEHKGYLEAQEVVGRIMDRPEYREMAWLVIDKLNDLNLGPAKLNRLDNLINRIYRPNTVGIGTFNIVGCRNTDLLEHVMKPWGSHLNQPTRGLFGSRPEHDPELRDIAKHISYYVKTNFKPSAEGWWKYQNYLYLCASDDYRSHVDIRLRNVVLPATTYSEIFAAGYVYSTSEQLERLLDFNSSTPTTHRDKQYWSVFRCLCWHQETAAISAELIHNFLADMLAYFQGQHGNKDERKYGLHALLFSLRIRERLPEFLADQDDPVRSGFNEQLLHGNLANVVPFTHFNNTGYPPTMLAGMKDMVDHGDNFSKFVWRFLNYQDTLKDREIGAGLATS